MNKDRHIIVKMDISTNISTGKCEGWWEMFTESKFLDGGHMETERAADYLHMMQVKLLAKRAVLRGTDPDENTFPPLDGQQELPF